MTINRLANVWFNRSAARFAVACMMKYLTQLIPIVVLAGTSQICSGNPYVSQGPFVNPSSSPGLPLPTHVPGKEYARANDPTGQVIDWDGAGGVQNGTFAHNGQVDGLGYGVRIATGIGNNDSFDLAFKLFEESFTSFTGTPSSIHLLFSVEGDGTIYYEPESAVQSNGKWAEPADIDAMNPPSDTVGLEVWGPEPGTNPNPSWPDIANYHSLVGDPNNIAIQGVAGGTVTTDQIANTIMVAHFGDNAANDPELSSTWSDLRASVDVDAFMVITPSSEPVTAADAIFSVRPGSFGSGNSTLMLDGGEIYFTNTSETVGQGFRQGFVRHAGHVWDTSFDVRSTFGVASENVNALEVVACELHPEHCPLPVPEPGGLLITGLGMSLLFVARRRKSGL